MILSTKPAKDLTATLEAHGLRASMDPTELVAPGVFVRLDSFQALTLTGELVGLTLFCVVPEAPHVKAADELAELATKVLEVVDPHGPITATMLQLSSDATPLPALSIPVTLTT